MALIRETPSSPFLHPNWLQLMGNVAPAKTCWMHVSDFLPWWHVTLMLFSISVLVVFQDY